LNIDFEDRACRLAWKQALRKSIVGTNPSDALDIGTGPGTLAQLWAELGCSVTGLDFSKAMLEAARELAAAKGLDIRFVEGDAETPPLRRKFDVISSRFVLFTLPHPGYAVRQWVSMLRPGGSLVLVGHDHGDNQRQAPPRRTARPSWQGDEKHQEALSHLPFMKHTAADLVVVMEAAGLREINRIPTEKLAASRAALRTRQPEAAISESTPFIVVGRK
jgi:ubiquinone/menaquinone biosynthesis C-methylase UbiE